MTNLLLLDKNLRDLFFEKDPFKVVEELEGNVYREYANRVTKEFYLNNQRYFVKYHKGAGWKEIFKNLIQLKLPYQISLDQLHYSLTLPEFLKVVKFL